MVVENGGLNLSPLSIYFCSASLPVLAGRGRFLQKTKGEILGKVGYCFLANEVTGPIPWKHHLQLYKWCPEISKWVSESKREVPSSARHFLPVEDMSGMGTWIFRFRFWPNSSGRMYLLENTGDFVEVQKGLSDGIQR